MEKSAEGWKYHTMQVSLPRANLAYPMTKSPPPLKFSWSQRDTIAPSEDFAPVLDRLLDDGITCNGNGVSCYKETEVERG